MDDNYDEKNKVGILSGKPPTERQGPLRRAPTWYAGETFGERRIGAGRRHRTRQGQYVSGQSYKTAGRPVQYPDVVRNKNGSLPSKRNKVARRIIRGALKRKFSSVERELKLPRAMQMQAREIARENKKSTRWAQRLYEQELSIHTPVFVPSKPALRAMRTARRKAARAGVVKDAISQLVDKMAKP